MISDFGPRTSIIIFEGISCSLFARFIDPKRRMSEPVKVVFIEIFLELRPLTIVSLAKPLEADEKRIMIRILRIIFLNQS